MCSGSKAGSYLRLTDFVYHSTLGLRVIKRGRTDTMAHARGTPSASADTRSCEERMMVALSMFFGEDAVITTPAIDHCLGFRDSKLNRGNYYVLSDWARH